MPGKKMPAFLMEMYSKKDEKGKGKGKAKAKPKAKGKGMAAKFKKVPKGGKTLMGTNKAGQRTAAKRG
jgi:hypothetical protein